MANYNKLKIVLPKGSLQQDTLKLFKEAGFEIIGYGSDDRNYRPTIDDKDVELKVSRPQEIPFYVAEGTYDLGITGYDWLLETRANAEEVIDLKYGKIQIILAIPNIHTEINSFEDLLTFSKKKTIRIATEYLNIAKRYVLDKTGVEPSISTPWYEIKRHHVSNIKLILSFGATEGKPPEDAEAIIDNATFEARTLRENNLKIIDTILPSSTARLIANPTSLKDPIKRKKIEYIKDYLKNVI